jgi:hypothetical protein
MIGKRAKILSPDHVERPAGLRASNPASHSQPSVLLSVKSGLRAAEIANLTWQMVADPTGEVGRSLELQDHAARKAAVE